MTTKHDSSERIYGAPFDPNKAILRTTPPDKFFNVTQTVPLQTALDSGEVGPTETLQVVELNGIAHAFLIRDLLMFDVAQGSTNGLEWIVTFCPICNAGAAFSAEIAGKTYHFGAGGIYNAMALLRDNETGSYWDHIHGGCLHGELRGQRLTRLDALRPMRSAEALTAFPSIQFASARLTSEERAESIADEQWYAAKHPEWPERWTNTLVVEDNRLPRFDMGLGLWAPTQARYYPILTLNAANNAILDMFAGRRLLVYMDVASGLPDAFYTTATKVQWQNERLVLNTGEVVEGGAINRRDGAPLVVERPFQLFQRWYGFAAMFPGCEIYGK